MGKTGDRILCPVRAWTSVITRIRQTNKKPSTTVNYCHIQNEERHTASVHYLSQQDTIATLRNSAKTHQKVLPYKSNDIGSHSIRSGAAVALFLAGVDPVEIMFMGRWSSDAFLLYLHPHIVEMAKDLSNRMVTQATYHSNPSLTHRTGNRDRKPNDPLAPGDPRSLIGQARIHGKSHNGPALGHAFIPKMHLF